MTTTTRVTRMLFLAGGLFLAGVAAAAEHRDQMAPGHQGMEAPAQHGMKAPEQKDGAGPALPTCEPEAGGLRLAPIGTNPELDRLREQQG